MQYFCPPPSIKSKKNPELSEAENTADKVGAFARDYDMMLHFAIAHMRRVDGALPPKQDGTKALDLLAPEGQHK
jgi:hypothetical protein